MGGNGFNGCLEAMQVAVDVAKSLHIVELGLVEELVSLEDEGAGSRDLCGLAAAEINEAILLDVRIGVSELAPLRA